MEDIRLRQFLNQGWFFPSRCAIHIISSITSPQYTDITDTKQERGDENEVIVVNRVFSYPFDLSNANDIWVFSTERIRIWTGDSDSHKTRRSHAAFTSKAVWRPPQHLYFHPSSLREADLGHVLLGGRRGRYGFCRDYGLMSWSKVLYYVRF